MATVSSGKKNKRWERGKNIVKKIFFIYLVIDKIQEKREVEELESSLYFFGKKDF